MEVVMIVFKIITIPIKIIIWLVRWLYQAFRGL